MASLSFDKSTGWWAVRYYAGPDQGRVKRTLCRHPTAWSPSRPPRKAPPEVEALAQPFREIERRAKAGEDVSMPQAIDLAKHADEYVTAYAHTHRDGSVLILRRVSAGFVAFCAARKVKDLRAVGPRLCAAWINARLAEGIQPATVQTQRAYLAAMFNTAYRQRLIKENPWEFARVEGVKDDDERRFWEEHELLKLVGVLDGWLKDWVVLDINTGLRVSALLGLRWRDINFDRNVLVVPPELSKSGKRYAVPLTPTANEVLARRFAASPDPAPDGWIFPSSKKKDQPFDKSTVYRHLAVAVKRTGIRDFGHYCHSLRHSFAVALVDRDVSIRVIQALLGHASYKTTEIYARLRPEKAAQVMGNFDFMADPPAPPSSLPTEETPSPPASDHDGDSN